MKKLLVLAFALAAYAQVNAQQQSQQQQRPRRQRARWDDITSLSIDSTTRDGYKLVFANNDTTFEKEGADVKKRMIETFFKVYPEEANTYNKNTAKRVVFFVDRNYNGVAATANMIVHFNPAWMLKKPTDIDVVTHEVMHIVQDYHDGAGPGWLTEGIADYVRAVYGVDNAGAKWYLPEKLRTDKDGKVQDYTASYRVTARFLLWIEKNYKKDLVVNLNNAMREHTYTDDIWKQQTGKTLDELWTAYAATFPKS
ncbi:basic secretory protein-like protein [Mucilaginibacter ximonensis]|uniref:Basic secretory protein-like protein n=1 Tax=Mucilaginibacter ximonensis TaxID=538021 RepID=A0ABW5YDX5_9SPHI